MELFPANAAERKVYDAAYNKARSYSLVVCIFAPAIPLWPFWYSITNAIGLEGAAIIVTAAQFALILTVADRIADFFGMRAVRHLRKAKDPRSA